MDAPTFKKEKIICLYKAVYFLYKYLNGIAKQKERIL